MSYENWNSFLKQKPNVRPFPSELPDPRGENYLTVTS